MTITATEVVGSIRSSDGTTILVIKHAAKRYRERVAPNLPGWPEALVDLRYHAREGVISAPPEWVYKRAQERADALPPLWLVLDNCALPLRGRNRPRAITVIAP